VSDVIEGFEFNKELGRIKRKKNQSWSTAYLDKCGVKYESKNGGIHLVIGNRFDFWPSTGKFINRKDQRAGRGVRNLIKLLKAGDFKDGN